LEKSGTPSLFPETREGLLHQGIGYNAAMVSLDLSAKAIELGLQAKTAAMVARADSVEAIRCKIWLLHSKAKLTPDPKERQELIDEAGRLQKQGRAAAESSGRWNDKTGRL
jgi:hypothetical protein